MDKFDLSRPLCIFILDLNPVAADVCPEAIIQEYVDSCPETESGDNFPDEACDVFPVPSPAIRGSTLPFGGWGRPKRSVKISQYHYALVVNNPIPPGTQYKWLDISGRGIPGDIDPRTRYSYEPMPYVDRPVTFRTPVPNKEIAIVMDRWGDYRSKVKYTKLDSWLAQKKFGGALVTLNIVQDNIRHEVHHQARPIEFEKSHQARVIQLEKSHHISPIQLEKSHQTRAIQIEESHQISPVEHEKSPHQVTPIKVEDSYKKQTEDLHKYESTVDQKDFIVIKKFENVKDENGQKKTTK